MPSSVVIVVPPPAASCSCGSQPTNKYQPISAKSAPQRSLHVTKEHWAKLTEGMPKYKQRLPLPKKTDKAAVKRPIIAPKSSADDTDPVFNGLCSEHKENQPPGMTSALKADNNRPKVLISKTVPPVRTGTTVTRLTPQQLADLNKMQSCNTVPISNSVQIIAAPAFVVTSTANSVSTTQTTERVTTSNAASLQQVRPFSAPVPIMHSSVTAPPIILRTSSAVTVLAPVLHQDANASGNSISVPAVTSVTTAAMTSVTSAQAPIIFYEVPNASGVAKGRKKKYEKTPDVTSTTSSAQHLVASPQPVVLQQLPPGQSQLASNHRQSTSNQRQFSVVSSAQGSVAPVVETSNVNLTSITTFSDNTVVSSAGLQLPATGESTTSFLALLQEEQPSQFDVTQSGELDSHLAAQPLNTVMTSGSSQQRNNTTTGDVIADAALSEATDSSAADVTPTSAAVTSETSPTPGGSCVSSPSPSLITMAMAEVMGVTASELATPESLQQMGISPAKIPAIAQQMARGTVHERL